MKSSSKGVSLSRGRNFTEGKVPSTCAKKILPVLYVSNNTIITVEFEESLWSFL
jgi:hypothetical protein